MSKYAAAIWETRLIEFVHLRLAIVLTILESFTYARFHGESISNEEFQSTFLPGLIAGSSALIVALLFEKSMASLRPEGMTVKTLAKFAFTLGAIKGVFFILLSINHMKEAHADSFFWDEVLIRIMTNSQMGGFVLLFMASFIIFREKYSSAQSLLLDSNERLKDEISEINSEIEHLKRISEIRILRKVSENLTFKELLGQTSLTTKEQWEQIANSLRIGVTKKIREESHRLGAKKQTSREEKLVLRDTTKFSNFYISPAFFVYFFSVYSLSINYEDTRPYSEYLSILSNAILMYVGTYLTQRYLSSHEKLSKTKQILSIIILGIYIQLSIVFSQTLFWGQSDLFLVISALPWTFALLAGINFIYSVFSQESNNSLVLMMTRKNLSNEKRILDEHRVYVENEIAKHLHGHLMLKSNSVIQSLDAMDDSSDYGKSQAILDELVKGFSLQSLRSVIEFNETNTDQLQGVKEEWGSFIDIGFEGDLSAFDQMPPTQRMVVSHAIEEMIANAYRHGQAQHVTITFQKSSNNQLTLTATDDGGGIAKGYKKGFGSKIFSQASNGLFSMENMSPCGAKVTLKVSINEQVEID